jgi:hypothetical protein
MAAERCVLLKSGKIVNIDDDDGALSDGRVEVGKIMEKSVIGKLGNKPPNNAYVKKRLGK